MTNSAVARAYLRTNRRNNIQLYPEDWKALPIPVATSAQQAPVIGLVDKILALKRTDIRSDVSALETEIDRLVANLYGIPPVETSFVEGIGHGKVRK